jgi:hypothetical protein|tara:strand:- start:3091 stop:3318 length:228 start_codon:yes stop_codon:yes gene_type:complete
VYQKPLKVDDLNPDTVKIIVQWDDMVVGASVFIPCIDTEKAKQQVEKVVTAKSWQVETRVRIEDKMFGLRIWRIV